MITKPIRKTLALILLPLGAAAVGGCGDDNADRISKQEYIARSNAICSETHRQSGEQFEAIVGEEGPPPRGQEAIFLSNAQRFLAEGAIPAIRENIERRRQLPIPEGDGEQIDAIIAAGEKALGEFDAIAADRARTRALFTGKIPDPAKEFDALSRGYGIEKCGGDE